MSMEDFDISSENGGDIQSLLAILETFTWQLNFMLGLEKPEIYKEEYCGLIKKEELEAVLPEYEEVYTAAKEIIAIYEKGIALKQYEKYLNQEQPNNSTQSENPFTRESNQ